MRLDRADLAVGDVLLAWHDDGRKGDVAYFRVEKVNRVTVDVLAENGQRARVRIGYFERKLKATAWSPWNREGV